MESVGDRIDRYFINALLMAGGASFGRALGGVIYGYILSRPYDSTASTIATIAGVLMGIYAHKRPPISNGVSSD